jgi:hypothetical protein
VIRRLVEEQQVRACAHDQCEREPCLLAAREACDLGGRHVAPEIEAAEVVAQFLLARLRLQAGEMPQRRLVEPQLLDLMLREIAEPQMLR